MIMEAHGSGGVSGSGVSGLGLKLHSEISGPF